MSELKSKKLAEELELREKLNCDSNTGVMALDDAAIEAILPEGVTLASIKQSQELESRFNNAVTYAGGMRSAEIFAENDDLTEIKLDFDFGHNKHHVFYSRNGTPVRNTIENFGHSGRGEMGKVYKAIGVAFANIND